MGNGSKINEMEEADKFGKMDRYMKVIGKMIWRMAKEGLFILEVMFMKVSGLTIKQMAKEFICIRMERLIQANGRMINKMVMANKNGLMVHFMKGTL